MYDAGLCADLGTAQRMAADPLNWPLASDPDSLEDRPDLAGREVP